MAREALPLVIEPEELEARLGDDDVLLVDLSKPATYRQYHIPGAVSLEYGRLVRAEKPVMGLLPEPERLAEVLGGLGLTPELHVVAYDDEGGGKASRLLWTLDVIGHGQFSLLNGGLHAWANEGHSLDNQPVKPEPTTYPVGGEFRDGIADREYILARLDDPGVALVDARTPEEFSGAKRLAERGGHIPGAVNLNWLETMDRRRNLRLLPAEALRATLEGLGISPDREVITYCQSHHRSAHTYVMLKWLGYPKVKGYPGAWSEWGNHPDTPVQT